MISKYPDLLAMYKKSLILIFFAIVNFVSANVNSVKEDSLKKRSAEEKFLYPQDLFLNLGFSDIHLYDIDSETPSIKELDEVKVVQERPVAERKTIVYNGLKRMIAKDNKFLNSFYKTLKISGYADTVNKLFIDHINLIVMKAGIDRVNLYTIGRKKATLKTRAKIDVTFTLYNFYEEATDTLKVSGFSDEFSTQNMAVPEYLESSQEALPQIFESAFTNAYLNLHKNSQFQKRLKFINDYMISDPLLVISSPTKLITDKTDAGEACMIIKTGESHGSGFAISNNGYIITSYHAIDEVINKKDSTLKVKVIIPSGEELEGKIVRHNRYRNVALIKIDKNTEKAFKLPAEKTYKNLKDVFTIGTPKSIELGQSMSVGIISSDRKINNNHFIQLGMSINSGNTGGPLFDAAGNLDGMMVAKLTGRNTEGVSFAVPAFLLEHYLNIKLQ